MVCPRKLLLAILEDSFLYEYWTINRIALTLLCSVKKLSGNDDDHSRNRKTLSLSKVALISSHLNYVLSLLCVPCYINDARFRPFFIHEFININSRSRSFRLLRRAIFRQSSLSSGKTSFAVGGVFFVTVKYRSSLAFLSNCLWKLSSFFFSTIADLNYAILLYVLILRYVSWTFAQVLWKSLLNGYEEVPKASACLLCRVIIISSGSDKGT